jgi:glycosyltransferase involved in cell wall biosynthesis
VRLLVFNLVTDADDPVLGFTSRWLSALARRWGEVDVLTMRAGRLDVPPNVRVHSVGKERGYSIPRRVLVFYRELIAIVRTRRPDVCFSHMMPDFSVMGAPLLLAARVPLVTWYAHPHRTLSLTLAHHVSARVATSFEAAYPYRRDKLVVLGQGIDTELFSPAGAPAAGVPIVLVVGRLSPVKDHPTILSAAGRLKREGTAFRLILLGGPATPRDAGYVERLRAQIRDEGLEADVELAGSVRPDEVVDWYRRCTVHVNATRTGSGDKVALEAMSCARPSLTANEGFRDVLAGQAEWLLFRYGDPADLFTRLARVLALGASERERIGQTLRDRIARHHSLEGLADRLTALLRAVASGRREGP